MKWILLACVLCLSGLALGQTRPLGAIGGGEADPNDYIDPAITGTERTLMVSILQELPQDQWDQVAYVDDADTLHSNRLALLADLETSQVNTDGTWTMGGETLSCPVREMTFPDDVFNPQPLAFYSVGHTHGPLDSMTLAQYDPFPGSGPYRRIISYVGRAGEQATVSLPTANASQPQLGAIFSLPDAQLPAAARSDASWVYMGGWSTVTTVPHHPGVDAGLAYSPTYRNWAPVISEGPDYRTVDAQGRRCSTGQTVNMSFSALHNNKTQLMVNATWNKPDSSGTNYHYNFTLVRLMHTQGWNFDGTGMYLKRATSIAQSPEQESHRTWSKNVHWTNAKIRAGGVLTNMNPWTASDMPSFGVQIYPNAATTTFPTVPVVTLSWVDWTNETISIELRH